jgi:hypothetical protein
MKEKMNIKELELMRKIRFRGYSVAELVSDSQWIDDGFGIHNVQYVDGKEECYLHTVHGVYGVYKDSVGQFTGLVDMNYEEIFEGHIVQYVDDSHVKREGTVVFKNGSFAIQNEVITSYRLTDYSIEIIGDSYKL